MLVGLLVVAHATACLAQLLPAPGPITREAASRPVSASDLFEKISPAVVRVRVADQNKRLLGQGSGFFISADGLMVTNYHVVNGAASATVLAGANHSYDVEGVVAFDAHCDLAILKVKAKDVPFCTLSDKLPKVGVKVYAIGSPKGLENTLSDGLVSGLRKALDDSMTFIQTSAPITYGSSGGPLLLEDGRIVGVTSSGYGEGNLNFAVPAVNVTRLLPKKITVTRLSRMKWDDQELAELEEPESDRTFDSIGALLQSAPPEYYPPGGRKPWAALQVGLFNDWAQSNCQGVSVTFKGIWNGQSMVRSGFISTKIEQPLRVDNVTYRLLFNPIFRTKEGPTIAKLKKGDKVVIKGIVSTARLNTGQRLSVRTGEEEDDYKIMRMGSLRSPALILMLVDAKISRDNPKPTATNVATRGPRPNKTEQEAQTQLNLGLMYISNGMTQKGKDTLMALIENYPKTKAAAKAKEKIAALE